MQKYYKEYVIKSYETDCYGFLRILSLMNFLQDIAVENADFLGFGMDVCLQKNLAWVGANYLIEIDRLPKIHEKIVIETWPAEGKIWGAIRDFIIRDEQSFPIIRASSQWVLIDFIRRRPVVLKKYFPHYEFLPERAVKQDFSKLPTLTETNAAQEFKVRYDDIDINKHANNSVYPVWASECVDHDFRMQHQPQEIELCFKKEALYGEQIVVLTKQENIESLHSIIDKNSGQELAQCRIKWRLFTSK